MNRYTYRICPFKYYDKTEHEKYYCYPQFEVSVIADNIKQALTKMKPIVRSYTNLKYEADLLRIDEYYTS